MTRSALRRLIDLPGVADLETKALMKPAYADPDRRADHPEVDACAKALFGLTGDEADATPLRDSLDPIEPLSPREQADAFEAAGWDVTDDKRRPLRVLGHFNQQLWLAIRGVAGSLPFLPDDNRPDPWGASLAAEAKRFRKR